jgi:hypothetical protein
MRACWDEIPRIKAERILAWADASSYPHLSSDGRMDFRRFWTERATVNVQQVSRQAVQFTFNGKAVPFNRFKRVMSRALGSGLEL